jgi:hypothetical protein
MNSTFVAVILQRQTVVCTVYRMFIIYAKPTVGGLLLGYVWPLPGIFIAVCLDKVSHLKAAMQSSFMYLCKICELFFFVCEYEVHLNPVFVSLSEYEDWCNSESSLL